MKVWIDVSNEAVWCLERIWTLCKTWTEGSRAKRCLVKILDAKVRLLNLNFGAAAYSCVALGKSLNLPGCQSSHPYKEKLNICYIRGVLGRYIRTSIINFSFLWISYLKTSIWEVFFLPRYHNNLLFRLWLGRMSFTLSFLVTCLPVS